MTNFAPLPENGCANCGAPLTGRYCAACGQRVVEDRDFSLLRLMRDWVAATFSLDSRGLVTLRRLLFSPGRLSLDYMAGRRSATFGPFQIFVFVTLVFFLLPDTYDIFKVPARWFFADVTGLVEAKMAALELTYEELSILYDSRVGTNSKLGLVVIIFGLALTSWIIGVGRLREFGKHLVIAVHDFCFVLSMFLAMIPIAVLTNGMWQSDANRRVFEVLTVLIVFVVFALSQRRVLRIGWLRASLHALVLFLVLMASVIAYRMAISWLTLWSL